MNIKIPGLACLVLALATGCSDELSSDAELQAMEKAEGLITVNGGEQLFTVMAGHDALVTDIQVAQGDFVYPLRDGRLYIEQNDDRHEREATVVYTCQDGSQTVCRLRQQPATRSAAAANFVRHHGVGYSYDAVSGGYCDLAFLRCQVINRAVVEALEQGDDVLETMKVEDYLHETNYGSYTAMSVEDYVQRNHFTADMDAELILFNGDASATLDVFEEGKVESYIHHNEVVMPRAYYHLEADAVAENSKDHPILLTSSFRRAVEALRQTDANDWKAVDDFINDYGTHVVTSAWLGAKLEMDIQVERRKWHTLTDKLIDVDFSIRSVFKASYASGDEKEVLDSLSDCRCRVNVLGGDLSKLTAVINMTSFGKTQGTANEQMLTDWMNSVLYDSDNLQESNVELTDMEVTPIWELISDAQTATRVRARIVSDASLMQQLLGNRNFINTSFTAHPASVSCRIGDKKQTFQNPDVVDVVSANRYVATVCREWVPEITDEEKVWVAYPIYEGYVKLGSGICIYGDEAYGVAWQTDHFEVKKLGTAPSDGNVYMTLGSLQPAKSDNMTYQESHLVLGCERPGGIGVDGSLAGVMKKVQKHFGHFYLEDTARYDNLPNWSYAADAPSEQAVYPSYIGNEWKNRMRRNDDYTYVLNITEIGYE